MGASAATWDSSTAIGFCCSEWDLWYVIASRMNVGINVLWYDAANLRVGNNQACHNLDICSNGTGRNGKGGDWVDVMFNWRYTF